MARTEKHQQHLKSNISHNDCRECRADTERRFVSTAQWSYQHVHEYLSYVAPRLKAIRDGENSINARQWLRDFRIALDRRINLKAESRPAWRKLCDSYQDRLKGMRHVHNVGCLKDFTRVKASALA